MTQPDPAPSDVVETPVEPEQDAPTPDPAPSDVVETDDEPGQAYPDPVEDEPTDPPVDEEPVEDEPTDPPVDDEPTDPPVDEEPTEDEPADPPVEEEPVDRYAVPTRSHIDEDRVEISDVDGGGLTLAEIRRFVDASTDIHEDSIVTVDGLVAQMDGSTYPSTVRVQGPRV